MLTLASFGLIRVIGGLFIILISVFLITQGDAVILSIPCIGLFIFCYMKIGFEVVSDFFQCSVDDTAFLLGCIYSGAVIFSFLGAHFVGNLMAGLGGIAIGILTMGVFGTEIAQGVVDLATIPLMGFAVLFALIVMFIGG